ncbi:flagellar motor switch protein FliM [Clostridiales bacterium PH28_bin88]|nr:flagellar motor switch protein FliM [Clostridiales bacterium PH28_bin88]
MKEVLSQSEIDLLLNALSSGELSAEDIKPQAEQAGIKNYDFRRPNKFSQDHLRTLSLIHDNFARLVSNFLSAYLRTSVQLKIASADQLTYEDFAVSIPAPTLLTVFTMAPLPGRGVVETNSAFIFPIIDLLFGGTGEMPRKVRELTEIEVNVMRNLNTRLLENMAFVWSDLFDVTTRVESMETNPRLTQIISPNETVAVITLTSMVGKHQGLINLCLPYQMLEPVVSRLSARHWLASGEGGDSEVHRLRLQKQLGGAQVEMTVLGGESRLTVREFLHLQVGDVITLDNLVGHDLDLLVANRPKFKVQPGLVGNKMAVQVTAMRKEETD